MMKALFFSTTQAVVPAVVLVVAVLSVALALWGGAPRADVEPLMAAGQAAGEQVYNILHQLSETNQGEDQG